VFLIVVEELYVNMTAVYCFREIYIFSFINCMSPSTHSGHVVAQVVEAMRYKPEGRGSIPDGVGNFH
jgi:hypothetical protein